MQDFQSFDRSRDHTDRKKWNVPGELVPFFAQKERKMERIYDVKMPLAEPAIVIWARVGS